MASAASTTSPKAAPRKPAASARKPAASRSTAKRSEPSTARRASTQATTAKRNATVAGKARTRAAKATVTEAKSGAAVVGTYAERAVLVPVGAALIARERVMDTVSDLVETYSTRKKTEAQLKRFERRGITARNRIDRETRKARTRVEKEMRRRGITVGRGVSDLDRVREEATKVVTGRVEDVSSQLQTVASKVQETVKSIA
ncbi:MAG: hypothetical protein QOF77_2274 [Solirubrobacteraceae bacterium]|jgi:hypothetical protein|nr:hypothetical protein [Solirubrobacteraceae bacterium]